VGFGDMTFPKKGNDDKTEKKDVLVIPMIELLGAVSRRKDVVECQIEKERCMKILKYLSGLEVELVSEAYFDAVVHYMESDKEKLNLQIKELCEARGEDLEWLANGIGMMFRVMTRLVNCRHGKPAIEKLAMIAEFLGVGFEELFSDSVKEVKAKKQRYISNYERETVDRIKTAIQDVTGCEFESYAVEGRQNDGALLRVMFSYFCYCHKVNSGRYLNRDRTVVYSYKRIYENEMQFTNGFKSLSDQISKRIDELSKVEQQSTVNKSITCI